MFGDMFLANNCSKVLASTWDHPEYVELDREVQLLTSINSDIRGINYTSNERNCMAVLHCNQTDKDFPGVYEDIVSNIVKGTLGRRNDMTNSHCDYLILNYGKLDNGIILVISALALLFSLPLCQDIEEAAVEEFVLDHHLTNRINLPAKIVRFTLRIKQYVLPWYATGATVTLLITNDISARNALLNFLAITIVLEADNIIPLLFFHDFSSTDRIVDVANVHGAGNIRMNFLWTRIFGISCSMMLLWILFDFMSLVDSPFVHHKNSCNSVLLVIKYLLMDFGPYACMLLFAIFQVPSDLKQFTNKCDGIHYIVSDLLLNGFIICSSGVVYAVLERILAPDAAIRH